MPNENKLWERPTKNVIFISQSEAERLEPVAGAAMISITDPDKSPATLGPWELLYRDSFYDGGYSESTIHTMKAAFRMNYASYIDSSQAERLSTFWMDWLVVVSIRSSFIAITANQEVAR